MRLLAELLLFPITGPVRGLQFVLKQIQAELEAQMLNEDRVQSALVELSLRHDLGEISGPEYDAQEEALLEELDAIRAYQEDLMDEEAMFLDVSDEEALYGPSSGEDLALTDADEGYGNEAYDQEDRRPDDAEGEANRR